MIWRAVFEAFLSALLVDPTAHASAGKDKAKAPAARAADAKARFEAAERRFDEFRNRARLLATAIAFAIGFELTILGRLIELRPKPAPSVALCPQCVLFLVTVVVFILTVLLQIRLLTRVIEKGYGTEKQYGLPSPKDVMRDTKRFDEEQVHEAIGSAYANAAAGWEKTNAELGPQVATLARDFARSMWGVFAVVLSLIVIVVLTW